MDEVYFHLNQRLENFQIWSGEVGQKLAELLEALVSSEGAQRMAEALKEGWEAAQAGAAGLAHTAAGLVPRAATIASFFHPDLNRATLYAGCIGFTIGGGIGLVVGVCLQSPSKPVTLMRAVAATSFSGPDSVSVLEDAVVPVVTEPDQVLVEVKAACLDSADLQVASGYARMLRRHAVPQHQVGELPLILGRGGSGVVVEVGRGVDHLEPGDQVMFYSPPWGPGTLAQHIVLPAHCLVAKPTRLSFEGAAALGFHGILAWRAACLHAGLTIANTHNKSVLVHCGSDGCGWALVQLAAGLGAREVVATALHRATPAITSLGATNVLSLESPHAESALAHRRFDVVFNTVGKVADKFCSSVVSEGGSVVSACLPALPSDNLGPILGSLHSLVVSLIGMERWCGWRRERSREGLEAVRKLAEAGRIRPLVDSVHTLDDLEAALTRLQASHPPLGRTVFTFSPRPTKSTKERPDLIS